MDDKRCRDCRFWHQTGGPPAQQRGPVILAAAAQGQAEPVPGQCRRKLAVGFIIVAATLPDGTAQQEVQPVSGYGPCASNFPACGHFLARVGVNGELVP